MRWSRGTSIAAALAGCFILAAPSGSPAWSLLGFTLPLTKRDFRIYNNFADPQSNDNATPDPNYPGASGAVAAVWKAAAEWGSRLHGPGGTGDPTQAGLGGNPSFPSGQPEGLANFDFSYQGLASGPGTLDENVVSASSTPLGPGVFAATLSPDPNGWKILFDDAQWVWEDGPGSNPCSPGVLDLQGVAAHEFGHALGLGHSSVAAATMVPTADCATSILSRSIEVDDREGIRVAYGDGSLPSSTKPVVTGVSGTLALGGGITLSGSNFDPSANEVWFTSMNAGLPRVVGGLSSGAAGTQISLTIPSDAPVPLSGDVLVRVPGNGPDRLSNAWPIAIGSAPAAPTLLSISPDPVDLAAVPQPILTITGADLAQVTSVALGGISVPPPYLTRTAGVLQLLLPILPGLGPVSVQATNPYGPSNLLTLTVTPADPPVLVTAPALGGTGIPFTADMFTVPGALVVLLLSPSNLPSSLPGLVDLSLGNGFTQLFLFPPLVASVANGSTQITFTIPSGGAGFPFYWQFVPVATGLGPPFPTSNWTSIFLFF